MSRGRDDTDPLDPYRLPTLAEQIELYRRYGDTELAIALLNYEWFGQGSANSPADVGADFHCPNCEENVRGVSRPRGPYCACPLCGDEPGMLVLGSGPK